MLRCTSLLPQRAKKAPTCVMLEVGSAFFMAFGWQEGWRIWQWMAPGVFFFQPVILATFVARWFNRAVFF